MAGYKPKLIEVALPLAAINKEAAREKSIRHGHPSTLHLWWARRPLAAARAVIWASLVDDPSGDESLSPEEQEVERQRLFKILERLVKWENSNNKKVLAEARAEIDRCFPDGPPPILDPFAGGGAIPLEAQRLGLKALSGDLNPVAVLIQKAMLEIPPRFAGLPPVHPDIDRDLNTWSGAQGLAADVEAYGEWMRDEAKRRIGHLYPDATDPNGEKLTPIAWIWARTVQSPDPSWRGHVPLVASWVLSNKKGKPKVWIEPIINREAQTISYEIRQGGEPSYKRTVTGGNGTCIATGSAIPVDYVRTEAQEGRIGAHMMALIAESPSGRRYCGAKLSDIVSTEPDIAASISLNEIDLYPRSISIHLYGFDAWHKLFTSRQLSALSTFQDLLKTVHEQVCSQAIMAGMSSGENRLKDGGSGAIAYADAVVTYLAFVIDKCADYWSTMATWAHGGFIRSTFARQAIQMTWDYAECNPFSSSTGSWDSMVGWVCGVVDGLSSGIEGRVAQQDARARTRSNCEAVISTDPPYYDNVGYANLSDFFYVWLRRSLSHVWPNELATLLTPKAEELIANHHRARSREAAKSHFESGMAEFMQEVAVAQNCAAPATIYYAYKATETKDGQIRSTGWATFLQAVVDAGLHVTATWPLRTERRGRMNEVGANALASSIVLACRPRSDSAPLSTRGQFMNALREELPKAVTVLQSGNIAPVDLPQSSIGPGIRVFSRYARVVEADGSSMPVSDALAIINDVLGEILDGEDVELDPDTRFAVTWYSEHAFEPDHSGDADNQARAKNTSLSGIEASGIGRARAGEFRLYRRDELDPDWSPLDDNRLTVWKATQQLVAALDHSEDKAADLLHQLGAYGDRGRQLGYLLFNKATEARNADEAAAYNGLINAWPILRSMTPDGQQQLL
ncbi:MAG: DUF1156 domain-containing protein [Acidimicrobiia bacterium]|nr:DUF1156 domain-containing protein [Acidimicrobiia bacterium]